MYIKQLEITCPECMYRYVASVSRDSVACYYITLHLDHIHTCYEQSITLLLLSSLYRSILNTYICWNKTVIH